MDTNSSHSAALISTLPASKSASGLAGGSAGRGLTGDLGGAADRDGKRSDFSSTIKNLNTDAVKETGSVKRTEQPEKSTAQANGKPSPAKADTDESTDAPPAETAAANEAQVDATGPESTAETNAETNTDGNELPAGGNELPAEMPDEAMADVLADTADVSASGSDLAEVSAEGEAVAGLAELPAEQAMANTAATSDEAAPLTDESTATEPSIVAAPVEATGSAAPDPAEVSEQVVAAATPPPATASTRSDGSTATVNGGVAASVDAEAPALTTSTGNGAAGGNLNQGGSTQPDTGKLQALAGEPAPKVATLADAGPGANQATGVNQATGPNAAAAAPSFGDLLGDTDPLPGQRPLQPMADPRSFAQGLNERLMVMSDGGVQTARIKLHPESLGPLEVRIRVEDDIARVSFSAHNGQTREALEQAMPRLREMFAEQGLQLRSDVSGGEGQQDTRSNPAQAAGNDSRDGSQFGTDADGRPARDLDPARMRARRMLDVYA